MRTTEWYSKHDWTVTPDEEAQLLRLIAAVAGLRTARPKDLARLLRQYPRARGQFSKDQLVAAYRHFCEVGRLSFEPEVLRRLQMKPTRTISGGGLTPITFFSQLLSLTYRLKRCSW